jgi:hypothetical protein
VRRNETRCKTSYETFGYGHGNVNTGQDKSSLDLSHATFGEMSRSLT